MRSVLVFCVGCVISVSGADARNITDRDRAPNLYRSSLVPFAADFEPRSAVRLSVREQTQFPGVKSIDGDDYLLSVRFEPTADVDGEANFGVKVYLVKSLQDESPAFISLEFRGAASAGSFDGFLSVRYRSTGAEAATEEVHLLGPRLWIQVLRSGSEILFLVSPESGEAEDLQTIGQVFLGQEEYAKCQHVPFILSAPGIDYLDVTAEIAKPSVGGEHDAE